ncbi:hypothetical protein CC1G_13823 [Coprinopsis cinerea okayama7|uniref:Uncharacterized protein n=1 Tax=Coprinopsis cinerea (strain Okayama-7 / 130 / ATCC MYA-4618 / FGSC 9003) TaxID=240176 RepID=D6RKE8_COPC7|nr:hypothetical protein CC1G_13823 [Coprinopsis cinerea okayama7\|eukprot:XP_002911788.1 hypothetical protein CC1G_13823 [Coprinopsis cinerea okayama7\
MVTSSHFQKESLGYILPILIITTTSPVTYQSKAPADAFLSSFIAPFRHTLAYLSLQELDGHSPEILSLQALQAVAHQTPNLVQFYAKRHALSKDSELEAVIAFLTGGDSKPNTATNFDDLLRCIMRYALWPKLQYFRWDCGDSTDISDRALLEFMRSRSGQSYYHDWRVVPLHQIVVTLPRKQNFPISLWDLEGLRYEICYTDKRGIRRNY